MRAEDKLQWINELGRRKKEMVHRWNYMRKPGLKWIEDQGVTCFCKNARDVSTFFYHDEKTACKRMMLMTGRLEGTLVQMTRREFKAQKEEAASGATSV